MLNSDDKVNQLNWCELFDTKTNTDLKVKTSDAVDIINT